MKDEQRQQTSAGKKKQNPQKLRNTIFVAAFVLLGLYYFYLRAQEQQEMQQVPGYATLATAAPAQEIPVPSSVPTTKPGASPSAANTASPTAMPKATPTAKPAAQKTEEEIPYVLAGENGQVRYDSNGNLIDTSNFLVSVKSPSQVLPRGFSVEDIPVFHGKAVLTVNGNVPFFTEAEIRLAKQGSFEYYGDLDSRGRCTVAFDCLSGDTMPAYGQKRGSISSIHPSGWKQARYDCVDSETVMTRAHLAGYMLSAENANEKNLITGTRYMNSDTMLVYEEDTADYLDHHINNHVLYRVTPFFRGSNLMADGILMEAMSVEDNGRSHQYCVYIYNVQPGLSFRYSNGASFYTGIFYDTRSSTVVTDDLKLQTYGMDFSSDTIHKKSCSEYAAVPSGEKASFYGDTSMIAEWPSLGYHLCSCMG